MPIDIFSKRQKRLRGEMPDVYQYDTLPGGLRTQVPRPECRGRSTVAKMAARFAASAG